MKMLYFLAILAPSLAFVQWNNNSDNYTSGTVTGAAFLSTSNYGINLAPANNGDAIIRRSNPGNLNISSNGGSSEIRFNYTYGGGSGGILIFDGGTSNHAGFKVNSSGHLLISASGGRVGIGTTSPKERLDLNGSFQIYPAGDAGANAALKLRLLAGPASSILQANSDYVWTDHDIIINAANTSGGNINQFVVHRSGNIGIGTNAPDARLAVNGDIHTREVKVDMSGAVAPDYVFEPDYDLPSLAELESYVIQNKHLPGIPSALEMEENGMNLKEMNLLLLRKVEELTLYVIALQKRDEMLLKEVEKLAGKK